MATFSVNSIVRKVGGSQSYKVAEVLPIVSVQKYKCKFEPNTMNQSLSFNFKESEIELVS